MAFSVRLSPEIEKRLTDLTIVSGRSKASLIREIVERRIDSVENEVNRELGLNDLSNAECA